MEFDANSFMKQLALELHKPANKKFPVRMVQVFKADDTWAMDLVEMPTAWAPGNKDYKYLLNIVDIFTRYAWSIPLKTKTAKEVLDAVINVMKEYQRAPKHIWSDDGKEFVNNQFDAFAKKNNIIRYSTYGPHKSTYVERFNRTEKTIMYRLLTENNNTKWLKLIPEIMDEYNSNVHSATKMTPIKASLPSSENELLINQQKRFEKRNKIQNQHFKVGDQVRISRIKPTFEKGYTVNWSFEIFTISEVIHSIPVTYKIKDELGNELSGSFYNQELQKTELGDVRLVEKTLKQKKVRGRKKYFVKWLGYPESMSSWVDEADFTHEF